MRVGLFLTNQNSVSSDMVVALDEEITMVYRAREHGWDLAWTEHHYLTQIVSILQPVLYLSI